MMDRAWIRLGYALLCLVAVPLAACDGCAPPPPSGTDGGDTTPPTTCNVDFDCGEDERCSDGHCAPIVLPPLDGGPGQDAGGDAGPAGVGVLAALPSTLVEFGAQRIGVPVQKQVTLANIGDAPLTVLQVFLDDNPTGEFTAAPTGSLNTTLGPGDTLAIQLTHTPADGLPDTAALKIVHTADEDDFFEIVLIAEFKGAPSISVTDDVALLDPNLSTISLGSVPIGNELSKQVFVRNDGSSDSILVITDAVLTPATAGFSLDLPSLDESGTLSSFDGFCPSGDVADCPVTAASCTDNLCVDDEGALLDSLSLLVRFTSTAVGVKTATLTLHYYEQGDSKQLDIELAAEGVSGSLQANPGAVSFTPAFTSRNEYSETVTVENTGAAAITVDGLSYDEAGAFSIAHALTFPLSLNPADAVSFDVRFYSEAEGLFEDTLTVLSSQDEDLTVPLSANARFEPTIVVDDTLDFGGVYGGTARTLPLTIRNAGPGVLNLDALSLSGPAASRFSIGAVTLPAELQPLASPTDDSPNVTVQITYFPDAALSGLGDVATLVIDSDDPDTPAASVDLSGESIKPVIALSASLVAFGSVAVCDEVPDRTFEVRNNGYGPLIVTDAVLTGHADFSVTPSDALPVQLFIGDVLTFTVSFVSSTTTGERSATLTIASTDVANPSAQVSFTATSTLPAGTTAVVDGGTCSYECADGFVDLNGDLGSGSSDGCEYACTATSADDPPDGFFVDANCDGIDGDPTRALFVSIDGSDVSAASGGGTRAQPMRTISYALSQASSAGPDHIYVSAGTYQESVTLKNGVSVYGAYSKANDWARSGSYTTILEHGALSSNRVIVIRGTSITSPTTIADLTVNALGTAVSGASVYGIHCSGCSGATFERNRITAGSAGNGSAGADGSDGAPSDSGGQGDNGAKDDDNAARQGGTAGSSSCFRPGGVGGDGGWENRAGSAGDTGSVSGSGGGTAGSGGSKNGCGGGGDGAAGGSGANGANGSDGAGGTAGGAIVSGFWDGNDGTSGTSGSSGHGGGGGGGGGGQGEDGCCSVCVDGAGGGGGGGGSGGCRGLRGLRGTAGGGSFGLFLHNSTGVVLTANIITSGDAGDGGSGGTGGAGAIGGTGGAGGNCCNGDEVGMGGNGGDGGNGGNGGDGGGGAGGDSFAVYRSSTTIDVSGNTLASGSGGLGGTSAGNDGANGLSGTVNPP